MEFACLDAAWVVESTLWQKCKLNRFVDGRQVLPEKDYRFVRRTMVSLVLGTDMALHSEIVKACFLLPIHDKSKQEAHDKCQCLIFRLFD